MQHHLFWGVFLLWQRETSVAAVSGAEGAAAELHRAVAAYGGDKSDAGTAKEGDQHRVRASEGLYQGTALLAPAFCGPCTPSRIDGPTNSLHFNSCSLSLVAVV